MEGWRVFTRPSSISVNPVTSLTSRTLMPAERRAVAVPPVEMRSQPSPTRPLAKSTRPVLSETESSAVGISDRDFRFELLEQRDHLHHPGINDVLDGEDASGERFSGIRFVHWNAPLGDDRSAVVVVVHHVHCDATFFRA